MDRKVDVINQRQLAPVEGEVQKQQPVKDSPADKLGRGKPGANRFQEDAFQSRLSPPAVLSAGSGRFLRSGVQLDIPNICPG